MASALPAHMAFCTPCSIAAPRHQAAPSVSRTHRVLEAECQVVWNLSVGSLTFPLAKGEPNPNPHPRVGCSS